MNDKFNRWAELASDSGILQAAVVTAGMCIFAAGMVAKVNGKADETAAPLQETCKTEPSATKSLPPKTSFSSLCPR